MAFLLFVIPNHSSGPDKANIQDGTGKGEILSHLFDVALKLVREEHVKGALGHRVHLSLSKKKPYDGVVGFCFLVKSGMVHRLLLVFPVPKPSLKCSNPRNHHMKRN